MDEELGTGDTGNWSLATGNSSARLAPRRVFGQRPTLAGKGSLADLEDVGTVADFEGQAGVLLKQPILHR